MIRLLGDKMKWFDVLALAALFGGAASAQPAQQPQSEARGDEAQVYVYRNWSYGSVFMTMEIYIDGKKILDLRNHGCAVIDISPGVHTLEENWRESNVFSAMPQPVRAKANWVGGKTYYYRLRSHVNWDPPPKKMLWSLDEVEPDVAKKDLPACKRHFDLTTM
jgi:hypothetical protein